jgi:hypothetical protein
VELNGSALLRNVAVINFQMRAGVGRGSTVARWRRITTEDEPIVTVLFIREYFHSAM